MARDARSERRHPSLSCCQVRGQQARNEDLLMRKGEGNASFFGKFRPGCVVHIGPGEEEIYLVTPSCASPERNLECIDVKVSQGVQET